MQSGEACDGESVIALDGAICRLHFGLTNLFGRFRVFITNFCVHI